MREMKSGLGLSQPIFVGLVTVAALVPPAWAYVNGGDFHSTLESFEKRLKGEGWGVSFGAPLLAE